jgi:hypothetical protein
MELEIHELFDLAAQEEGRDEFLQISTPQSTKIGWRNKGQNE